MNGSDLYQSKKIFVQRPISLDISNALKNFQTKLDNNISRVIETVISRANVLKLPHIQKSESVQENEKNVNKSQYEKNRDSHHKKQKLRISKDLSLRLKKTISYSQEDVDLSLTIGQRTQRSTRPIGNKKFQKPKFVKKLPQILPKNIRDDPFSKQIPILVSDINKGIFTLMNKGIINKDVDIGNAFQKGQPPIKTKMAVMHHFEQKLVKQYTLEPLSISQKQKATVTIDSIKQQQNNEQQTGWALTNIKQNKRSIVPKNQKPKQLKQQKTQYKQLQYINEVESYHWQFRSYKMIKSQSYKKFKIMHRLQFGNMQNIIYQIQKYLQRNYISLIYIDVKKALKYCRLSRKLHNNQIQSCFISFQKDQYRKFFRLNQSKKIKQKIAAQLIIKVLQMWKFKKLYLIYRKKKLAQKKIGNWISSKILYKRLKKKLKEKSLNQMVQLQALQRKFTKTYQQMQSVKHFQIHIPNFRYDREKQHLIQKMNIEITRIFNIKNPNRNIIYVSPFDLNTQITNYYYKILQLGQVKNYKDRITFISSDPQNDFRFRFSNSKSLYYSSKSLKKIKRKIENHPAYIVSSYPLDQDMKLSLFLKIPLLYTYNIAQKLNMRNESILKFKQLQLNTIDCNLIEKNSIFSVYDILIKINNFYEETKTKKIIIKINNTNNGTGIAVVNLPVLKIQDLLSKTDLIKNHYYQNTIQYYKSLILNGGVIQKFENNSTAISVCVFLKPSGQFEILATFQKISNNLVNICYKFPQNKISHQTLMNFITPLIEHLKSNQYYGYLNTNLICDSNSNLYFQKINCCLTKQMSSLYYFNYLMEGKFQITSGKYFAKVIDNIIYQGDIQKPVQKIESRTFFYSPFILHFGLSQIQIKNFFQLCRVQGISFDLEKKYGATFILIDSLKASIGLLTTAKQSKISLKLTLLTLTFLLKQNYKSASDSVREKQIKYKQKWNIASIKAKLDQYLDQLKIQIQN